MPSTRAPAAAGTVSWSAGDGDRPLGSAAGIPVRVESREVAAPDPLQLFEALQRTRPPGDSYLLESLDGPEQDRHAAVVGWGRLAELRCHPDRLELHGSEPLLARLAEVVSEAVGRPAEPSGDGHGWPLAGGPALWRVLRAVQRGFRVETDVPAGRFAFGFLAAFTYEAAWAMEELPQNQVPADQPLCTLALFRHTVWYDLDGGGARHLVASGPQLPAARDGADALPQAPAAPAAEVPAAPVPRAVRDSATAEEYHAWVKRCLGHIEVGDSYQIQIGHRIEVETELTPLQAYRRLRHRNPSPYMYVIPWAGRTVVGASPELFIRIEDGRISMRPIAGTAVRAADPQEDARRVAGLRASEKERAEHIMLVDLCRNDIGRVCVPGTLAVDAMMDVEPFAYVHHLVSTVSGTLRPEADVWAAVCATFPAGTMTGAPKLRAMEIINGIESTPRGIYAGALGLLDVRGFTMLALCIRTAVHEGGRYTIQASAGVVADSEPAAEWRETLAKLSATYWSLTGEELLP
ncbi:anthranilate synthase component I family protein [Kitasatospora sp. NPDC006697]|uniref:anthranilate synthase component I family protein n=1 Tax=Kitasatospora sp. NPDC006697 TaxID=3364020 RepID=UPI0036A8878D